MLRLELNLNTFDQSTDTYADGVAFAIERMGSIRIPKHIEIDCANKQVSMAFWKALLSFKRCRLTRIDHLILKNFTDISLFCLSKVLHDLDIVPEMIVINDPSSVLSAH